MGSGGKGGGGGGAGDMIEYGNKALGLQKEIYDSQREDAQPWFQTGSAAVGQLGTLLGLKTAPKEVSNNFDNDYKAWYGVTNPNQFADYIGKDLFYDTKNGKLGTSGDVNLGKIQSGNAGLDEALPGARQKVQDYLTANYKDNSSDAGFGTLAKKFGTEDFEADPGYQFRLGEGTKALERKLNASGKTYSPEAAKALMEYNQNFGSNEYNNSYNRYNIDQDNLFNRLATLSGFGQTASGQIANAGSNYANAGSELYTGMGNAITAANLAKDQNKGSMFKSLVGAGAQLGSAYLMSDKRLKMDIEPFDEVNGFKRYKFRYIHDKMEGIDRPYIGVLAQDVLEKDPMAVRMNEDGYYAVNYDKIGFPMEEVR